MSKKQTNPIKQLGDSLKKSSWASIIESFITMIIGICLIAWPDTIIKVFAYIIGIFLVVKGGYQIINYFAVKGQNDFLNNGLLVGVISLLIGIIAIVMGEDLANIFRVIIGIWMIYESLVRINIAIKLNAAKIKSWSYILILAIIMLALGIFIIFYNGAVLTIIGWMIIISSLAGIIGDIMFMQHMNQVVDTITSKEK